MIGPPLEPNAYAHYVAEQLDIMRQNGDYSAVIRCDQAWREIIVDHLTTSGHAVGNVKSLGEYILVLFPENRE